MIVLIINIFIILAYSIYQGIVSLTLTLLFDRINADLFDDETSHDYGEDEDEDKPGNLKRIIMIILITCVFAAAIIALILVLVLKGSSIDDEGVPKGYNGYTVVDESDNKWNFEATLKKTENVKLPVNVDNSTNPEYQDLFLRVSMMNDQTYRIKINPISLNTTKCEELKMDINDCKLTSETMQYENVWEVPDDLLGNTKDDYSMRLSYGSFDHK